MIGSYYQSFPQDAVRGLANVSTQASLAHEALQSLLMGTLGRYVPWAEQTVSGWKDILVPNQNYDLFPINAESLQRAEDMAQGNPVGMIGILFREPVPMRVVDDLFATGPYQAMRGEAVYRVDDDKETPTPQFLYFGALMDEGTHDGYGSYEALEQTVEAAGGKLVFVMPSDRGGEERSHPTLPASTVIVASQAPNPGASNPAVEPEDPAASSSTHGPGYYVGAVVSLLGGAFVGYHVFRKR